jgi:hypothetical protein
MEKVDLIKAKELFAGKSPAMSRYETKLKAFQVAAEEAPERYMFWYTVWTFIEHKASSTLTEAAAEAKLKHYPSMEVFYCKFPNSQTPMPEILKGRKNLQTEKTSSYEQVSELIYEKTGVSVPESDLQDKKAAWSDKPLNDRIRSFMMEAGETKVKDEAVQRIYNCLLEADSRKRKECLNNCKK